MNQPTDHVSEDELVRRIEDAKQKVDVSKKYYHYKNPQDQYEIVGIGLDENTEQPRVLYRPLYNDSGIIWIRSVENFLDEVTDAEGNVTTRFTQVE